MIPELGHFSLILALCTSVVLGTVPLIGSFSGHRGWMAFARPASYALLFLVGLSYACLTWAFIDHDFSVLYVANTSNTSLPFMYRIAGVWGGHEGSILFWCFIQAVWTGAVAFFGRSIPTVLLARVLAVLGLISIGFLLFVLLTSNPFERLFPTPIDGASLNPLLQDPGMAIHPPMLYMGYVGFSVAFAFAIAALIGGQLDAATLRFMRPWTNIAWMFLTIGISLGSFWAYYELGWGGWWFWDPVENASFMPWLVGTALLHSLAASEKRGVFKAWTVLLAVLAFSLSLLGTFLVRSGVLTSVHSFAADPTRGLYILMFLGVVVGGSLVLYAIRANRLQSSASYALVSRESGILLNNVLLVVACAAVLLGTLYPLFLDALDMGKISVGPQYFNAVFVPLMLPIVATVGIGALLNWKSDKLDGRRRALALIAVAAVVGGTVLAMRYTPFKITALASLALALWVIGGVIFGLWHRVRNKRARLSAVMQAPAAFWGMSLAHIGIGMFTLGVALTSIYTVEKTVRMSVGDEHTIGARTFTFTTLEESRGPNYRAVVGVFDVVEDGKSLEAIRAEKRFYDVRRDTMTEAGIDGTLSRDLFIALGEPLDDGSAWSVRLQVKPLIRWIWLGTVFMALGGLVAALDRRYRRVAVKSAAPAGSSIPRRETSAAVAAGGAGSNVGGMSGGLSRSVHDPAGSGASGVSAGGSVLGRSPRCPGSPAGRSVVAMLTKLLPLVLFLAISAFLWKGLSLDPGVLPSPLIDKPAPVFSVATLRPGEASATVAMPVSEQASVSDQTVDTIAGSPAATEARTTAEMFDSSAMAGKVWMLNIWASWCGPCAQEHPQLVKLASMRDVPIVGLNYKDDPQAAQAWLNRHGDMFSDVLSDVDGSVGLDWGVYGVPETFIIDADGRVRFKHVGPVLPDDLNETLLPVLDELMGTPS